MAIDHCLAMTGEEISACPQLPEKICYMACHFSPVDDDLCDLPAALPPGSLLILNDRLPLRRHDPDRIGDRLDEAMTRFSCSGLLLDFERPGIPALASLTHRLFQRFGEDLGVSSLYARETEGPVFLSPLPCATHLRDHVFPWAGRELWLDLSPSPGTLVLTPDGSHWAPPEARSPDVPVHRDPSLYCHYQIHTKNTARFSLFRTGEDLRRMEPEAESLGIRRMIGLYQELQGLWP